ncbi:MAG TPA: class I SAM-dependent methyltransferase [Rhizomicrobium sp.]|nr:class I SAM-dependent methyltransferase [Rhizomicrobium sp.]
MKNIAQRLADISAHHGPVIATVDGYDVIDCEACGFRHIDPLFTDQQLKKFYEAEFYQSEKAEYFERMEADKEWWMLRYHHYYELLEANAPGAGRRILDIGSGPGYFLEAGRERGWQALGFEPSAMAADYARGRGLAVVNDFFSAAAAREHGTFDAVSLSMVLEHVRDPIQLITDARNLLAPGGVLLLISPNDFNPLQMTLWKELGFAPWWINPKHHLNYFDTVSAKSFLEARRFEVRHLETSYPLENFLLAGRNYVGNPALGRECHNERKAFESTLLRHDRARLKALAASWAAQGIGREFILVGKKL